MPDHVQLIDSPLRPADGWSYGLPEIMKAIKGPAAWQSTTCSIAPERLSGGVLRSRFGVE
jgi:hypothetical protein